MSRRNQRGVTLIELMVGMLIGLIATVVITQVLFLAEGQKRTTTSGSDAQVNGALALYTLQRELQMAGYGLITKRDVLGCPTRGRWGGADVNFTLAPVIITQGATDNDPDTITIMSATKTAAALPTLVTKEHLPGDTVFQVQNLVGMSTGDALIAVPLSIDASNWCSLLSVSATSTDAGGVHRVNHDVSAAAPWNTAPAATVFPPSGYAYNSYLINAGQLVVRQFSLNTATRTLQEATGGTATGAALGAANDLYPEIVNLQALYGKDTNNDGVVDTYDKATPATQAQWQQVKVIRVAVVARSSQYEKDVVMTAQPQWDVGGDVTVAVDGARTCGSSRCIELNVTAVGADWDHFRYKVYEAVVPLRNALWSQ